MFNAIWAVVAAFVVGLALGGRLVHRRWRSRSVAAKRRIEAPNSHYSSEGVRHLEDHERWKGIEMAGLHPLNREEVARLFSIVEARGVKSLSERERIFLDSITSLAGRRGG